MASVKEQAGKDRVIFVTKEDHAAPSSAELVEEDPNDPYEEKGLILPSGEINWNCPCLGGMASGPCGTPFKEAFSCFHVSGEEVKGSDCLEQFRAMQECMQSYPDLYPQDQDEDEERDPPRDAPDSAPAGEPSPAPPPPAPAPERDSNPTLPPPSPSETPVGS